MKEHSILFTAPMVRAILEGRKTQTRRIVKTQPANGWEFDGTYGRITSKHPMRGKFGAFIRRGVGTDFPEWDLIPIRYGAPADRLWVKETYRFSSAHDGLAPCEVPPGDSVEYLADPEKILTGKIRPSIHMPRWASRITLEITNIRVERLNEISEEDAIAEGVQKGRDGYWDGSSHRIKGTPKAMNSAKEAFADLWESINGEGSWGANPWVWVIEFQRIGKEVVL